MILLIIFAFVEPVFYHPLKPANSWDKSKSRRFIGSQLYLSNCFLTLTTSSELYYLDHQITTAVKIPLSSTFFPKEYSS